MQHPSAMPPAPVRAPGSRLERGGCGNARCTASGSRQLLSCPATLRGPGGRAAILAGRALCLERPPHNSEQGLQAGAAHALLAPLAVAVPQAAVVQHWRHHLDVVPGA